MLPDFLTACRTDFVDADLCFVAHTYRDGRRLAWMLAHLRRHYPGARVVVIADGDDDPNLPAIARDHAAEFLAGDRLFPLHHGGKVVHRMLEVFLDRPCAYLFKVDPDTGIHRRFRHLPRLDGFFGSLQVSQNGWLTSLQGGCVGHTLAAVRTLAASQLLLDPRLATDRQSTWACDPVIEQYCAERNLVSTDWLLGWAATRLGIRMFGLDEIQSNWRSYVPNGDKRFAITHPCKEKL